MSKRIMKHVAWVAPVAAIISCSAGEPTGTDSSGVSIGRDTSVVHGIHAGDGTELGRLAERFHLASYVLLAHTTDGHRDAGRALLRDAREETVAKVDWTAVPGSFTVDADRDAHRFGLTLVGASLQFSRDGVDTRRFTLDEAQKAQANPEAFRAPEDAVDPVELATATLFDVVGADALAASIPRLAPSRSTGAPPSTGGPSERKPFDAFGSDTTCGQCYVSRNPGVLTPGAPASVAVGDGVAWTRTSICSTTDILLAQSCSNALCIGCYETDGCNAICTVGDFLCFFAYESGTACGGCDTSACSSGGGGVTGEGDAGGGGADAGPTCGDGTCSAGEDCGSCPEDCGECGGGGGGGGGGECDVCAFSYPGECDSGYWCVDYGACLDDGASCLTFDPGF